MGEWREMTLGQFTSLQRGHDLPEGHRTPGKVPVMGSFGITGVHSVARVRGPGVTVGRSGASIGVVSYVDDAYWPLNTCLYVTDFHGNNPRFAYYFLRTLDLASLNSGSAQPSLNRNFVHPIKIVVPDRPEQDRIASLLGALDDKIGVNRRMNERLEALARALFRDWFVDFGPTRAKMESRDPYLAPDLWSLFPDALDDEDRPTGWKRTDLTSVASLNPESWSRSRAPTEITYVDLANTKWGEIELAQHLRWEHAPSRAQRILRPGDTIVGTVRPGNGSYCLIGDDGFTGSTGFAVLRPKHPRYREWTYVAATGRENIERLAHLADGAAYPAVRPDAVAATEVVIPGTEVVIDRFSEVALPLMDRMLANHRENWTLARMRDFLLRKLMSGELRLKDAEKVVEAVA